MGKGNYCIVCRDNKENINVKLKGNELMFRFPKSPTRRKKWIDNLNLNNSLIKTGSKVCEVHFKKSQFARTFLKRDAVPESLSETRSCASFALYRPVPLTLSFTCDPTPSSSPGLDRTTALGVDKALPSAEARSAPPKQDLVLNRLREIKSQRLRKERKIDKQRIRRLKSRVEVLKSRLMARVDVHTILSSNVTFRQIIEAQLARYRKKKSRFTDHEKTSALSIYFSCGSHGYKTLKKMGFMLPGNSTLKRWTKDFHMFAGTNQQLLSTLRECVADFSESDKDCLVTWDEMSIKEFVEYNKYHDRLEGLVNFGSQGSNLQSANEVLVFMVRGINAAWKFPIAFYFSKNATPSEVLSNLVTENISNMQEIGLKVRIAICDMSFTNQGLYRSWGISKVNPFKMFNGAKVYFAHDTPHLIKLIRNNLMKHKFVLSDSRGNEQVIKWSHITNFYTKDKRVASRLAPRLTDSHIYLKDYSKMRVKLATQVFSHSVYAAMRTLVRKKILKRDHLATAMFVKKIDEIFDFLNMSSVNNDKWGRCAYYFYSNIQMLDEYVRFFESISIPSMPRQPEFLNGLILTITTIKFLALDLQAEGYAYVLTRNLQQDCLENFFSLVRSRGGYCKNPTARSFRMSFKFLFFATLIHSPTSGNTEVRNENFEKYMVNMQHFMRIKGQSGSVSTPTFTAAACLNDSIQLTSVEAANFFCVKLARRLKFAKEQEAEVASYMGAACIHAILKKTDCKLCSEMLVTKSQLGSSRVSNYILIDFKQYDTTHDHLAYLNTTENKLFMYVNSVFVTNICQILNANGEEIMSNLIQNYTKNEGVNSWLNDKCQEHRMLILKYFLRAKLFRLVKDKNESIRQIKTFSQTRRDLRNQ